MKLKHLKGICIFSTHAGCFMDSIFFLCSIFLLMLLKTCYHRDQSWLCTCAHPALQPKLKFSILSLLLCLRDSSATTEKQHIVFSSGTVHKNVTRHPLSWHFLLMKQKLYQIVCPWQYLDRNCNAAKAGTSGKNLGNS